MVHVMPDTNNVRMQDFDCVHYRFGQLHNRSEQRMAFNHAKPITNLQQEFYRSQQRSPGAAKTSYTTVIKHRLP